MGKTCNAGACVCAPDGGVGETAEQTCDDNIDNDCDGMKDCLDATCSGRTCAANGFTCTASACTCSGNGGTAMATENYRCNDGFDNDCDGKIDCQDSSCNGAQCGSTGSGFFCSAMTCVCSGNGGAVQATETNCADGRDNDCDGLVDCLDSNCPACGVQTPGDGGVQTFNYVKTASSQPFIDACAQTGSLSYLPSADDETTGHIPMPISFVFYGVARTQFWISSNGMIGFSNSLDSGNTHGSCLPTSTVSRPAIDVYFDDLVATPTGVCVAVTGAAPYRQLVVTWKNMTHFDFAGATLNFSAILTESTNTIDLIYPTMTGPAAALGSQALVGIQNFNGSAFVQHLCNQAGGISSGTAIRFTP